MSSSTEQIQIQRQRQREPGGGNYLQSPSPEALNAYSLDGCRKRKIQQEAGGKPGEDSILKPSKKCFQEEGSNQCEVI